MKRKQPEYCIHNPNTPAKTAEYLFQLFLRVNREKAESALKQPAGALDHRK